MSWTDERIDTLTRMWEGGATASQIADELGGVSRNAVIGKAHRLGLKARPSPVKALDRVEPDPPASIVADATEAVVIEPADAVASVVVDEIDPIGDDYGLDNGGEEEAEADDIGPAVSEPSVPPVPVVRVVSVGPGGFLRQGPGDQQPPIPPAPPRRLVPSRPSPEIAEKTSLLELNDRICRWPVGHPGEPDFHFCGDKVNPGFPYCVDHCGRAYQAQLPRGARRPPPPMPFGGPRVR